MACITNVITDFYTDMIKKLLVVIRNQEDKYSELVKNNDELEEKNTDLQLEIEKLKFENRELEEKYKEIELKNDDLEDRIYNISNENK